MPKRKSTAQPKLIKDAVTPRLAGEGAGERSDPLAHLHRPLTQDDLDRVRHIEGFPLGADEDVIALSAPPYYTACPNPFLEDFIRAYGKPYYETTDTYHREPFAADVSEGKSDPIYNAHGYHTKVPHKAIMRYILHYTEPGDIVFDGFCGTGMTGVAVQMCARPDAEFKAQIEAEMPQVRWGARRAVLCDLSPEATFIAYNYNAPVDTEEFEREARRILDEVEVEFGWMYETLHTDGKTKGRISNTVWSEVFTCPECSCEIVFLDEALDTNTKRVKEEFPCPHCGALVGKRILQKCRVTVYDPVLGQTVQTLRRQPVLIEYTLKQKHTKRIELHDLDLLKRVESISAPTNLVTNEIPYMHMTHQRMRLANYGVTHLHHFFLPRTQHVLSALWARAVAVEDTRLRNMLLFWIDSHLANLSIQNRYRPEVSFPYNPLTGVYYISSLISEANPFIAYENKSARIRRAFAGYTPSAVDSVISTGDCGGIVNLPSDSVDYIFTDPPFGENIYYADLNFVTESWHRVRTNAQSEAIVDQAKDKKLFDYQQLMYRCFIQCYRVLKPSHWMTVVFHNSHNAVWNAIQEALSSAGFVVADVRTLDKQQSSYRQVTAASAAKQDLVISAYKPRTDFEQRFLKEAGTEHGAWDFVRQHLNHLPVFVEKNAAVEIIVERQNYLLFDRMVAFHIQRGASIPLSASEFYAGLRQRFPERDGMYFTAEQVAEYDAKRAQVAQVEQLSLFVSDEKSAVQWLRVELEREPQTYQDVQPKFLQELHQARHEKLPELSQLLAENFLKDDQDRWYVPDPARGQDLEKLRDKGLLKEFATYQESKGKLKTFRTEAVRAGWKVAWAKREYATIIEIARRLPEDVLQEDAALLMYYDNAVMRSDG